MIVEKENGEKEVLVDFQSYQMGYRAAAKDFTGERSGNDIGLLIARFVLYVAFFYVVITFVSKE